ncbi:DUF86 domain-containing protein [Infirmifilum lucidum]|uniref:DUF86 domain-containing protein n=1 Tax=Infirmifilum lucidum TaxID=2776706 RepID=A0A7L9FIV3_9CREN|nr:HepT-like ribonuclease domain-containing protein [Infirmifilum lucidum]QOJ79282.1 DUF86 domain-containing protein [Infirmifilum lucidum]
MTAALHHIARRGFSLAPETPTATLRLLAERGLVTVDEVEDVARLIRLRNLLVHRYWVVDDKKIHDEARRNFKKVVSLVERIKRLYGV